MMVGTLRFAHLTTLVFGARLQPHRHCQRSEAIKNLSATGFWIASSQGLLAMTEGRPSYTARCRAAASPASASSSLSRSSGLIRNPFMPASKQA